MKEKTMDLTTGSVPKKLLVFALPMIVASVLQSIYGVVDMLIVGQFVGKEGLAGCASGTSITTLITMLGIGFTTGIQMIVAQFRGRGDHEGMQRVFGTGITLLVVSSVLVLFVAYPMARRLLALINTPEESFEAAYRYLIICLAGTPFVLLYNAICAGLRGMGDSKRPMIFVLISCVVNIVLDLLFVALIPWGTAGAALATVSAQCAACISAAVYLYRRRAALGMQLNFAAFVPSRARVKMLLKLGIPCALQSSALDIGMVLLTGVINTFGVDAAAGYSVGGRVGGLLSIPLFCISGAASTMAGQCCGAGKLDRLKRSVYWNLLICTVFAVVVAILLQVGSVCGALIRLFNTDPAVVRIGTQYLRLFAFAYVIISVMYSFNVASNGVGNTTMTMVSVLMDGVVGRLTLVYLAVYVFAAGLTGVFLATTLAPIFGAVVSVAYFYSGHWKRYRVDR